MFNCNYGKIRRGGYVFITYKGDHDPRHVHIFRDGHEIAKWNLDAWVLMSGKVDKRILSLLKELVEESRIMKIRSVLVNRRKKALEIMTNKGSLNLPFSRLPLKPSVHDKLKVAYVDSELANRAITYTLISGKEASVHLDAFLDYNRDPEFLRNSTLHQLTIDAMKLVQESGLSKHELIRRLKTSPSQLYRLLDPANYKKSVDEMLRLLAALGYRVDMKLIKEAA